MSFQNQVRSAQGYYELGMLEEAWAELNAVSKDEQGEPPVLQMTLLLHLKESRWNEGLEISRRLCEVDGDSSMGYIHAAYCLHELGQTVDAKQLLLTGPNSLLREPIYHYNMGCYEVALGEVEEGRRCLQHAFEMDRKLLDVARKDPDLECLRDTL